MRVTCSLFQGTQGYLRVLNNCPLYGISPTMGWGVYGSSRYAISSGVNWRANAATALSRCAIFVAPITGAITDFLCNNQAREIWACGTRCFSATSATRSMIRASAAAVASYFCLAIGSVSRRREFYDTARAKRPEANGL